MLSGCCCSLGCELRGMGVGRVNPDRQGPLKSAFPHCNEMPEIISLCRERFPLAHSLRGFSPWQLHTLALDLWWSNVPHDKEETGSHNPLRGQAPSNDLTFSHFYLFIYLLIYFWQCWDLAQGVRLARQVLCHLNHSTAPGPHLLKAPSSLCSTTSWGPSL
jgi:hypothetical protein